ncbi:CobW/HypB/UreG, nucleotide-binding domain-containing protein [Chytridium lagenaria]|nr:CobW/HypB/UreG, nucleotide-binding domain-containing protein [Chytridium lagenaria]
MPATTPVTIFTGFLGAGKTTTILALIRRLPPSYKVVILKNEFGEVSVDSQIAAQSNVEVTEIMNGCLCCVLVGQMKTALLEIKEKFNPDRIIIETSGSAFPAPLAWQVRQIADQGFSLDAIVTIVDCVNFRGYEDTSYTAKLQAKYTDLILLSKHELVSERDLDLVLDRINDLNEDTPKLKCEGLEGVSTDVVFGIDTKLFALTEEKNGLVMDEHHHKEIDIIQITSTKSIDKEVVEEVFSKIGDSVYRVKGFLGELGGMDFELGVWEVYVGGE